MYLEEPKSTKQVISEMTLTVFVIVVVLFALFGGIAWLAINSANHAEHVIETYGPIYVTEYDGGVTRSIDMTTGMICYYGGDSGTSCEEVGRNEAVDLVYEDVQRRSE